MTAMVATDAGGSRVEAGSSAVVTHQIVINNLIAFEKGETLMIEAVSPSEQQPDYKYLVTSPWLGTKFQLSDADLVMAPAPQAAAPFAPTAQFAQQQQYTAPPGQPYPATMAPVLAGRQPQPSARVAKGKRGSLVGGAFGIVIAGALIASTFLPWFSSRALGSGWALMRGTSSLTGRGFTIVLHANSTVFLTGFFPLLFGALILIGSVVMLFRHRIAGAAIFLLALVSTGAAALDLYMVYIKMTPITPGVGLWAFAGASLLALGLGIVGMASAGG